MNTVTIRYATAGDDLDRLAALDSSVVPAAPQLVAEADGDVIAAISVRDGAAIADPFTRSADAVNLLRVAARLTASRDSSPSQARLMPVLRRRARQLSAKPRGRRLVPRTAH